MENAIKRSRGPKALAPDVKRTHVVMMRLNQVELFSLDAKRGKRQRAEWLRLLMLDTLPIDIPSVNVDTSDKVARLGNNLNQITRHLNSGKYPDNALPLIIELTELMRTIHKQLNGVKL
jgi:hypothetical protein